MNISVNCHNPTKAEINELDSCRTIGISSGSYDNVTLFFAKDDDSLEQFVANLYEQLNKEPKDVD